MDKIATKNIKVIRASDLHEQPLRGLRATHMWVDELTDFYQDWRNAIEARVATKGGFYVELQSKRNIEEAQAWVIERKIDGWLRIGVFFWFHEEQDALEFTLRWR